MLYVLGVTNGDGADDGDNEGRPPPTKPPTGGQAFCSTVRQPFGWLASIVRIAKFYI